MDSQNFAPDNCQPHAAQQNVWRAGDMNLRPMPSSYTAPICPACGYCSNCGQIQPAGQRQAQPGLFGGSNQGAHSGPR